MAILRDLAGRGQDRDAAAALQRIAGNLLDEAWGISPDECVEVCRAGCRASRVAGVEDLDFAAEWAAEWAFAHDLAGDRGAGWDVLLETMRDERLGATPGRIRACAVAAEWAWAAARVAVAAECAETARALYARMPANLDRASQGYAEAYWREAEILAQLAAGRPDLAAAHRERVLAAAKIADVPELLARAHLRRIAVLLGLERFGAAERAATEALAEVYGADRRAIVTARAVAISRVAESDPARLEDAVDEFEAVLAEPNLPEAFRLGNLVRLVDALSRFGPAQRERALDRLDEAEALLQTLVDDREDAFLEEEIYTAALRWRLSPASARGPLRERLRAVHARTLASWARHGHDQAAGVRQFDYSNLVLEALLESCEGHRGGAAEALALMAEASAVGTLARQLGLGAPDEQQVRRLAPAGGGLLAYVIGWHRLFVLAVDGKGMEFVGVAEDQEALDRRRELVAAWRRGAGDPASGQVVVQQLLPRRIAKRVATWSTVRVVGLDEHGHVPFEWLPWEGGLLGDRLAVSYLPSLTVGAHLAARRVKPASGGWVTVLGDAPAAAARARWPELDPIEPPARAVERWLEDGQMIRGADAGVAALFAGDGVRGLTVVAHGVYDVAESRSGLVLGDGVAWVGEIGAAGPSQRCPDRVVLLACGAGRQVPLRGDDGAHGLAGAFLAAGAAEVVLSSERLRQDFALAVDASLRRHLARGESLTAALQLARRELAAAWSDRQPAFGLLRAVGLPPP